MDEGVDQTLGNRDKAILLMNVNTFINRIVLPHLRSLELNKIGGSGGVKTSPSRMWMRERRPFWSSAIPDTERYAFCSNLVSQDYTIVNPETLQVVALAVRERLRLSPAEFEYPLRLKSNDNCAMDDEEAERLINIFDKVGKIWETQL